MSNNTDLENLIKTNYLPIAFIGSGVSTNYCDWITFLSKLMKESGLNIKENIYSLDLDTLLLLADEAINILTDSEVDEFIQGTFKPSDEIPNFFKSLVMAPFAFYITTNYDSNIENTYFSVNGNKLPVILPENISDSLKYLRRNTPFLLKIHGTFDRPETCVIGYEKYLDCIYRNLELKHILTILLSIRPIVFMGYGHRDPHISRYLEREYTIQTKRMRKFAYTKSDSLPVSLKARFKKCNISNIEVENWEELNKLLEQYSFVHIIDNYSQYRHKYMNAFNDFINTGNSELLWSALIFAFVSSDAGYASEITELYKVVETNYLVKNKIISNKLYDFIYSIVIAQYFKRLGDEEKSVELFNQLEGLTNFNLEVINTIRARAYRYIGIFWLRPPKSSLKNVEKAKAMFDQAETLLAEKSSFEYLDLKKWQSVLIGDVECHEESARKLLENARLAEDIGYLKNSAWSRYGALEQLILNDINIDKVNIIEELRKCLLHFNNLSHLRGLSSTYYLLAYYFYKTSKNNELINDHLNLSKSMAYINKDNRLIKKCDELTSMLD